MTKPTGQKIGTVPEKDRDSRLKKALRENLKRRKQASAGLSAEGGHLRRDSALGFDRKLRPADGE